MSQPNLSPLKQALLRIEELEARLERSERLQHEPIAIVGIGCRLPGSVHGPEEFWHLLRDGRDATVEVPPDRWDVDRYYDPDKEIPGKTYSRRGGFLDAVDTFDAAFFKISPREVAVMDPQQRLLLEVAWEAFEHAGERPRSLENSQTGVFVAVSTNDYWNLQVRHNDLTQITAYQGSGVAYSMASGRLSYVFGLQGPSISIDTACSGSLVAVHLACQSLRTGGCRMALAGGVNLILSPDNSVIFAKSKMLAADGRCKTFDAAADGFGEGEGCGLIVLKRLSDAIADGSKIWAIIRGSAVNQDGPSSGLTAPNGAAQESVIRQAMSDGGVKPAEIGYVEAHGTGTSLGDPIEVKALAAVLGEGHSRDVPLWVGSVKSNIGHLEAAAGISGLIKLVLSLYHKTIPPSLHFQKPNPHIPWAEIPVVVPTTAVGWPSVEGRRVGGISAFGFSGTNAHVILEQGPEPQHQLRDTEIEDRPAHVLAISGATSEALKSLAARYADAPSGVPEAALADICWSANTGRSHESHRLAVVAGNATEMRATLNSYAEGAKPKNATEGVIESGSKPKLAFLFTGQGSQYAGMGQALYRSQPVFRAALERCAEILGPHLAKPLLSVMFPAGGSSDFLNQTIYTQPALFSLEYALAEMWQSWGVKPFALLGHSVGEYVAAVISGVWTLEDGLALIAKRAALMQELPPGGAMAAIFADEAKVVEALRGRTGLSIAAVNGPQNIVISGDAAGVRDVVRELASSGVGSQQLTVSHAFHSPLMEPILDRFESVASAMTFSTAKIPIASNVSGSLIRGSDALNSAYLRRHLRQPVRFADGLRALRAAGAGLFLEIGPNPTLVNMGRRVLSQNETLWFSSLTKNHDEWDAILNTLAGLYVHGAEVDWRGFDQPYRRSRVAIPTYPFQRQRYWFEKNPEPKFAPHSSADSSSATANNDVKDSLYEVRWQEQPLESTAQDALSYAPDSKWLIFEDDSGAGQELIRVIESRSEKAIRVRRGQTFESVDEFHFVLDANNPGDYKLLLQRAFPTGRCRGIVHLWSLDASSSNFLDTERLDREQTFGARSVLHLVQAFANSLDKSGRLALITRAAQASGREDRLCVSQAPIWGLAKVIALEHPELHCLRIDLDSVPNQDEMRVLAAELFTGTPEDQVMFRGQKRYVARLARFEGLVFRDNGGLAGKGGPEAQLLRSNGSYLITGGLRGLGLLVAKRFAELGARNLILMGRTEPSLHAEEVIVGLRQMGVKVLVARADVAREAEVRGALMRAAESMPPIAGVIHAAGIWNDGVFLEKLDWHQFEEVLAPKVRGSWNLFQSLRHQPLDFFVCFSSAAALFGAAGQGDYAAANAFQDAFAHFLRASGIPAQSINWGPWAEVGGAAEDSIHKRISSRGIETIMPALGLRALETILGLDVANIAVTPMRWDKFVDSFHESARTVFFSELVKQKEASGLGRELPIQVNVPLLERLVHAALTQRHKLLVDYVSGVLAGVLGLGAGNAIDRHQPFTDMGLDSLMAVELRNVLGRGLDVKQHIPATVAFDYPNVEELTSYLEKQLPLNSGGVNESNRPNQFETIKNADELDNIEQLTDEEVDRLVAARAASGRKLLERT